MPKKVVQYTPTPFDLIQIGRGAFINPVNHPDTMRVSNKSTVITSNVISIDGACFETENTIYQPVELE